MDAHTLARRLRPAKPAALTLALLATAALPAESHAQAPVTLPRPTLSAEWAVEQQVRERWLHGRQQPRFTPFIDSRQWVIVDSIRDAASARRFYLTLTRSADGRDSALIVLDRAGRVARLDVGRAASSRRGRLPEDSVRWEDMRRRAPGGGGVTLGASRLWDLVPTLPATSPHVGVTWRDTIAREAVDGPFRQAMRGTRVSRIVGERAVAGHRLWIVRDSAAVTYEEQYPELERTLSGVRVDRTVSGVLVGVHLYDPALRLSRQRDDTTRLAGQATLHYPDRRSFRTPARYERTRHWELLDAPAYAARLTALRAASSRAVGGMVRVPDDDVEKRLVRGDTGARDSLLAAWQRATDPDSAALIFQMLELWDGRSAGSRARMEQVRLAAGDTSYLYALLANRASRRHPFDTTDVRAMLPFMQDPGLAWSFDLSREELQESLVQSLTTRPPAAPPSPGAAACSPAACRMLAAQWRSAREPRLRDVGLVALVSMDPARWADTVLALDGPQHPLLHPAALLARGVGATWPAASHAPMPPAGSDWHAWLEWMDGRDPRYVAIKAQTSLPDRIRRDTLPQLRFEASHVTAIRFYQARTGREVVAELQRGYDGATSDSARLVFGAMLQGLGALQLTEPQIADGFRSHEPARVDLARRSLLEGFEKSATPTSSDVAAPLLERVVAAIVDSAPLWPSAAADRRAVPGGPAAFHLPRGPVFLDTLRLPPRIRAEWASRVKLMPPDAWIAREARQPGVFYTLGSVTTWGHFARVDVAASGRLARKPDESPQAYAGGATYYLMNVDGAWVAVAELWWIT